jgi:hypothetical protein
VCVCVCGCVGVGVGGWKTINRGNGQKTDCEKRPSLCLKYSLPPALPPSLPPYIEQLVLQHHHGVVVADGGLH